MRKNLAKLYLMQTNTVFFEILTIMTFEYYQKQIKKYFS